MSDSMARFFEQESQNLGPRTFQELVQKKTVLMEVACSPNSHLTSEVQKALGRESAAVRCSHWNGCDLETSDGIKHCLKLIDQLDPGHVWISPECGPYSPMQAVNQRAPEQTAELSASGKVPCVNTLVPVVSGSTVFSVEYMSHGNLRKGVRLGGCL